MLVFSMIETGKKGASIFSRLVVGRSSSIRQCFSDRASQKGCYRFLNNDKVNEEALIEEMTHRCRLLADKRHLIIIQDTSSASGIRKVLFFVTITDTNIAVIIKTLKINRSPMITWLNE